MSRTTNKKRILYVITKAATFGGAQRYVYELAVSAKAHGYEVAVAAGSEGILTEKLETAHIPVFITTGLQRDISVGKEWRALKALKAAITNWEPDVIHINSAKAGVLGSLAARYCRVPRIIFTAHGWPFFEDRPWWWKLLTWKLSWLTVFLAHQTICVSEFDKTHAHFPFLKHKLTRIYNGVIKPPLLSRDEARAILLPSLQIEEHTTDLQLVAIGELHPNKNIELLLYALSTLRRTAPTMRCFLTVMGSGELESQLKASVRSRRLEQFVYFAGNIENPYNYLAAFDVLLMPSKKEGLPYTLLYGIAAGIPIIASKVGGIPEILTNATGGKLIDPKRAATLLDALRTSYYEKQNGVGWQTPHELGEFALARMIERTFALYQ